MRLVKEICTCQTLFPQLYFHQTYIGYTVWKMFSSLCNSLYVRTSDSYTLHPILFLQDIDNNRYRC